MSYGSPAKRYSGSRNFSGRKGRKKRQDFHEHRTSRPRDEEETDLESVRERTVISLRMMGRQRLSSEVGGYSLENWTRNFNLLLDDFSQRVGTGNLPSEFTEMKSRLPSILAPPDTTRIDADVEAARRELAEARSKMQEERGRLMEKIEDLKEEQKRTTVELDEKRRELSRLEEEESSAGLFHRILGRGSKRAWADALLGRISELESSLESLPGEIAKLQALKGNAERRGTAESSPYADDWLRIESLEARVGDLETRRDDLLHLTEERERTATILADIVSGMSLGREESARSARGQPSA